MNHSDFFLLWREPGTKDAALRRSAARCWQGRLLAVLVAALASLPLLALTPAAPGQDAAGIQRWALADTNGDRWAISLFEQPDPAYAEGWRLRLNALAPARRPDHQRPLDIQDSRGSHWRLANRSHEQVPAAEAAIPAGSAQFDLAGLSPRPNGVLPLKLTIPIANGGEQALMLSPEIVDAIGRLPLPDGPSG